MAGSDQRTCQLAARPGDVVFVPARTAVIVVDMQNDFGSVGGMFDRAGIDISSIEKIVPSIAALLARARDSGVTVVFLKMAFSPDLSDVAPSSPTWQKHIPMKAGEVVTAPNGSPSRILIRDTWNTEVIDELAPQPGDLQVYKHRYSGFFETSLDATLNDAGIDTLLFVGATTSVCVESTVRDAMFRDYQCVVVEDCVAEPIGADASRTNHDATMLVLELLFASISSSAAVTAALT